MPVRATRIDRFLEEWLGRWPPRGAHEIVASPLRAAPGWDGKQHPVFGVRDGAERWVISVAPDLAAARDPLGGVETFEGVFRWTESPAPLPDVGEWRRADDPVVPDWLRPFGGEVLVVLDEAGAYLAGVGLKRHLPTGWEIAVGTEPEARGRGYARRLVATAARRVLDLDAVPLYIHDDDNIASAKAAAGAGIPDRGWRVLTAKEEG